MRYKRLVLLFVGIMTFFVALNYVVWKVWTEDLLTNRNSDGGDLVRMGYILGSKMPRKNSYDLPRRHIPLKEFKGQKIDMVTIGDSFSNGGGGGRNNYYQDYIASMNNLSVLNLGEFRNVDFVTMISIMNNNGFLDRLKPSYVLIGATERGYKNMSIDLDFARNIPMSEVRQYMRFYDRKLPKIAFINNGNMKFIINSLIYKFRDHGLFSDVYVGRLSQEMFSVKNSNTLLYIPYKVTITKAEVEKLNDNMNILADRLAVKGIRLVYMPYVDKYPLYDEWLIRKRFSASNFFELLRPLPKRYVFIDTKAILLKELEKGEKDIFFADDTHSSWKASEKIFESITFRH
jgi:hypothetical protein